MPSSLDVAHFFYPQGESSISLPEIAQHIESQLSFFIQCYSDELKQRRISLEAVNGIRDDTKSQMLFIVKALWTEEIIKEECRNPRRRMILDDLRKADKISSIHGANHQIIKPFFRELIQDLDTKTTLFLPHELSREGIRAFYDDLIQGEDDELENWIDVLTPFL